LRKNKRNVIAINGIRMQISNMNQVQSTATIHLLLTDMITVGEMQMILWKNKAFRKKSSLNFLMNVAYWIMVQSKMIMNYYWTTLLQRRKDYSATIKRYQLGLRIYRYTHFIIRLLNQTGRNKNRILVNCLEFWVKKHLSRQLNSH